MTRKSWIDTDGIDEATGNSRTFWAQMRLDLAAGQFWADEIKKYREEPAKALSMALDHLPLPAAFRNAAVSARTLIRMRKKSKETFEQELTLLYWLAAIRSFMLDYAPRLKEPGFNVVESIPGRYLCSLPYTYSELGFRELPLLNKTDVKWLTEAWGEPTSHTTLNAMYRPVWEENESKLVFRRKKERSAMFDLLRSGGD